MAKNKLQVVFASAEAAPFVKTGGLGDVAGSLPQALVKAGVDVIVMVPKYSTIGDEFKSQMEHVSDFYVPLGWRNEYCGLEKLNYQGVDYYFIDNHHYFDRSYPYGFYDDGERFAFFSKAITEALQHLPEGFECDVLHCNDWHTAMAPIFLREFYQGLPLYERVKTVFTIHNIAFQGQFSDKMLNDVLGLAHIPAAAGQLRCDATSINFMQGALNYTDSITTVSPTYAWEITTSDYGERLDGILRRRKSILRGIVNGIDEPSWDPATDYQIAQNYSVADMAGKAVCKRALQEELGLEVRDDRPLMVMVTRLTRQKGMDLVTYSLDRILSGGVQVAVLGTGDASYEDAMRYGTLPVVRETGGLRDTVKPYNYDTGEGTGFSFANFNGDEMGDAVFRGARLFWDNREAFDNVVKQAMQQDFSWTKSANEYIDLYRDLHPEIEFTPAAPEPEPEPKAEPKPEADKTPEVKAEPKPEPEPKAEKAPEPKTEVKPAAKKAAPAKKPAAAKATATKTTAAKAAPKAATETKAAAKPAAKATAAKAAAPAPKAATAKATAKPVATKAATATKAAVKPTAAKPAATKTTAAKATTATKATAAKSAAEKATATKATAAKPAAKAAAAKTAAAKTAAPATKPAVKPAAKPAATKAAATATKAAAAKPAAKPATAKAATKAAEAKPAAKAPTKRKA